MVVAKFATLMAQVAEIQIDTHIDEICSSNFQTASELRLLRYAESGHLVSALGPSALGKANNKLRFYSECAPLARATVLASTNDLFTTIRLAIVLLAN